MIDINRIFQLNNQDLDSMIDVLELNEDRLYAWLVQGSPTVVIDDLDESVAYVRRLREFITARRPDYVGPYRDLLPIWGN
jgi:hypothetical protein